MKGLSNPKIHNVRFYKPKVKAVYCIALQSQENKLALSRADGNLEIWNLQNLPFIERIIASSTENFSIEGLAWCDLRLFSVGLHGLLIEYDLYKLGVKSRAVVTGEAAFCLDIHQQKLQVAVGTEQGYLNIFRINEDEVLFEKFLDKQEGRILCLKFDYSGEFIVSGSQDAIRIWSVKTNQALHKIITGRTEHNKPTIVWCLAVTKDFTIISGDSRGILSIWDGRLGAQLESYQSHRADILSLCLSEDESSLYCAGLDPNIVNYVRIRVKDNSQKWVRSIQRKIHESDIRALALHGNKLYSSGADGYLACSYHPPKTVLRFPPILQNSFVTVCSEARYILLRYPKNLEVWSLGESGNEKDKQSGLYNVEKRPKKLVVVQKIVKIDEGIERKEGINCATISNDARYIVYSTRLGIRIFKFLCDETASKLIPLEIGEDLEKIPIVSAAFSLNNQLIIAPNIGGLSVLQFDGNRTIVVQNITTKFDIEDTVTLLVVSKGSTDQFIVAGDVKGNIAVWICKNNHYVSYCKLPKYASCPTALNFHLKESLLLVAYSDGHILEYDLNHRELSKFSRLFSKSIHTQMMSRTSTIRNVSYDPRNHNLIIVHDDEGIFIIEKEKKKSNENKGSKVLKLENEAKEAGFKSIKKYKHLVYFGWLSNEEMVAVEVSPLSLSEQVTPAQIQSTFGRK